MNTIVNDIKAVEDRFINQLGSGQNAAASLNDMIASVIKSRDTTVLSRAIFRATNKGDAQAAQVVKLCIGQVWPGAKLKSKKDAVPSIEIKGIAADDVAAQRIASAAGKKLSIRHSAFRKAVVGDVNKSKPDFVVADWAKRQAKDHTMAELDAMIAALQAQRKELAAKAVK